jgi:hypothetical protein
MSKIVDIADLSKVVYYGYWPITFRRSGMRIDVFEATDEFNDFVQGANRTLSIAVDQHSLCEKAASPWTPPRADQIAAVWPDLTDTPLEGVRYQPAGGMSGWWLMPAGFTGEFGDMVPKHLYHVTRLRPDVLPLLGLAPGYAFNQQREVIWFEQGVANS